MTKEDDEAKRRGTGRSTRGSTPRLSVRCFEERKRDGESTEATQECPTSEIEAVVAVVSAALFLRVSAENAHGSGNRLSHVLKRGCLDDRDERITQRS